ncbi:MAG TPA: NAD(P)/FAD-dependent oxidoreductase [Candidatus Saccharimonadales bacterium]|nr:NAD(P)/FAD-dependent oxidoreductase [Candidatus Saccharimonadales bacterium]
MPATYDAIIIGAGHNGLVTAAYLARAGRKVLVLERRDQVGGCVVTEELWPGFKVSTASYVNSLFRPEIIRDLDLKRHGFQMLPRSPSSFTPLPDGRFLLMGPDKEMTRREVSKFSKKDAESLPRFEAMLERVADFLEPMLIETPANPWSMKAGNLAQLAKTAWNFRKLGRDGQQAIEILTGAANPILDRWFESEEVKTTISTDAIIGAFATPSMPGTAYVLFHHVMGECDGARGVWGYVRGGMGALSNAIAAAAREHGADIKVNAPVARILVREGRASGVVLTDGTEYRASKVVSCLDANVTFLRLMESKELPAEFLDAVRHLDYSSASCKINLALSEAPNFTCLPGKGVGPQHHGTIHISPTRNYIEKAYDCAKYGYISENPVIEATIPSSLDDTVAPPGKHVMSMFTQYFPYKLAPDAGTLEENKKRYAERCIDIMTEYAPNFRSSVLNYQVLAPADLETMFGLTGGNIMQGAMSLSSLGFMRPLPGYADYRTPVPGLYLCGAATHPGGGVMGACGYNAAREILKDR